MSSPPTQLTEKDERRNALRLCRDAIRTACRDSVIADQLDTLDGVPVQTLSQEIYKAGLLRLVELSTHAEYDGHKIKALEVLMHLRIEEARLLLDANATQSGQQPVAAVSANNVLTREEAKEVLMQRRRIVNAGTESK